MAYARKLIAQEEKIIGIARVHWVYVLQGLMWFLGFTGAAWALNWLVLRGLYIITSSMGGKFVPLTLLSLNNTFMYFMMGAGFFLFFMMVIKVLFSEVALTDRRVIQKRGLFFIKVHQIDLEEIRGENMDLGYLGRLLGYGYIMMDCRFIGDVRLPAIERPEGFIRALHTARSKAQDSLSIIVGKGQATPANLVRQEARQEAGEQKQNAESSRADVQRPEIEPPQPQTPEIIPPQQEPGPEVNPPRTPTELPVPPTQPPPQPAPSEPQPVQPPAPQPPLQPPPGTGAAAGQALSAPSALDPNILSDLVRQMAPQMAQQVARELVQQGVIEPSAGKDDGEDEADSEGLMGLFNQVRLEDLRPSRGGKKRPAIH